MDFFSFKKVSHLSAFLDVNAVTIDEINANTPIIEIGIKIFSKYAEDIDKEIEIAADAKKEKKAIYFTTLDFLKN